MPESPLPPFSTFSQEFELGGQPWSLQSSARRWQEFADQATSAASAMRGMDASRFKGEEGELYLDKLDSELPERLDTTAEAHGGVSKAVGNYADELSTGRTGMLPLRTAAPGAHSRVQTAVAWVNRAEATLAAARVKEAAAAVASKTASASAALTGGATSGAAAAAASAHTEAIAATRAAEADLRAARTEHTNATSAWEGLRTDAAQIHTDMNTAGETAKRAIEQEAQKRFSENPSGLAALGESISDWFSDNADWLSTLSEVLMTAGGVIAMLPIPGAALVGGAMMVAGGAIALGLWATGNMSTSQMAMSMVGAIPGVGKGAQLAGRGIKAAGKGGTKSSRAATNGKTARGKDPINLATGEVVDDWTDLTIGGTLPLVLTRYFRSGFRDGISFGPSQASMLDMRLEVGVDGVLFIGEDGSVQEFDGHPSDDGAEILPPYANTPLSFVDGAYRVRDVPLGITYEFALFGDKASVSAAAIAPESSLAGVTDSSVSVWLSAVVHRTGHRIEVEYDQRTGRPRALHHSGGATVHIDADAATGRVMGLAVSDAQTDMTTVSLYEYSANGDMTAHYDSTGVPFRYTWDHDHRMTSWTDRVGTSYHYVYDLAGRIAMQGGSRGIYPLAAVHLDDLGTDAPEGGTVMVTIEPVTDLAPAEEGDTRIGERFARLDALPVVKALASGGLTAVGLDTGGRAGDADRDNPVAWADVASPDLTEDPVLGRIHAWVYRSNAAGQLWRIVSPEGVVTDFDRDSRHNLVKRVDGDGSTLRWEVDEFGCTSASIGPDGSVSRVEYAPLGVPVKHVDASGRVTEIELDDMGNITSVEGPDGARTAYEYEVRASGSVPTRVYESDGSVTDLSHDDAGRLVRAIEASGAVWSFERNLFGDVTEEMDPDGNVTSSEWSAAGQLLSQRHPDGTNEIFRYDANGDCLSHTDPAGRTTCMEYGPMGEPTGTIDANGGRIDVALDTKLTERCVTNPDGLQWSFERDRDGYVIAETDFNGARTEYELDGLRRQRVTVDALGRRRVRRFDSAGRLVEISSDDGLTVLTYDSFGNLTEAANPDAVVRLEYDDLGRVAAETVNGVRVQSSWDRVGRRTAREVSGVDGQRWATRFEYDAGGQLAQTSSSGPGSDRAIALSSRFSYDTMGRPVHRTIGDETVVETGWDSRSRKTYEGVRVGAQGHAAAGRSWTYRADGYVSAITDVLRGTRAIELDAVGRVQTVRDGGSQSGAGSAMPRDEQVVAERYDYAPSGTLTVADALTTATDPGMATSPLAGASTHRDEPRMSIDGTRVVRRGRTRYAYDAQGQLVEMATTRLSRKAEVTRFTYTVDGQIRTAQLPDGTTWTYTYDAFGRRVGKRHHDTGGKVLADVVFGWDDDTLAYEVTTVGPADDIDGAREPARSTTRVFAYHPLSGLPLEQHVQRVHAGGDDVAVEVRCHAIITDLAGAPTELIDPDTGAVVGHAVSTIWGETNWIGESTPLAFTGQQVDSETGLHYNRFRFYDPAIATYTAPDPLGIDPNPASNNAYVHNPHTWVDPLGLKRCPDGDRGIVYRRTNRDTREEYIGRSRNPTTFKARQWAHNRMLPGGKQHDFEVIGRANPQNQQLRRLEEYHIRQGGGPQSAGGPLANKRFEMADLKYQRAGGDLSPVEYSESMRNIDAAIEFVR